MVTTLLFDLDDTLYEQWTYYVQVHKAVANYIANKYQKDPQKIQKKALAILKKYGSEYGHIYNDILNEEKFYSPKKLSELINYYRNFKPKIKLYPDFKEILPILEKKYKLGIITNGVPLVQKNKCESLKIAKRFSLILFTRELGKKNEKPNFLPFRIALKKLKSKFYETVYIGDNPYKDFQGAKKLNIKTIRILRGEYKYQKETLPNLIDYEITNYNKKFLNLIENI